MEDTSSHKKIPLCVDLDGTLLRTDTLLESILPALKNNLFLFILIPIWLLKGRAYLKKRISLIGRPKAASLPFNEQVLDYVKSEKNNGREIILATATDIEIAMEIANYLGIFSKVIATDGIINIRAENKKDALVSLYDLKGFDYIGDSKADIPVWQAANSALLVEPSKRLLNKVNKKSNVSKVFERKTNTFKLLIKEIRVYQWLKNILIFVPFLLAHKIDFDIIQRSILAFTAFSFCASFVYLLNDLMDIESDRQHPRKRFRPVASGYLPIQLAIISAPILLFAGLFISIFLPLKFIIILIFYLSLTTAYSFYLKRFILIDVFTLAGLYTIRLLAGAAATGVDASPWLLAFSMFSFLSLAILKRYTELKVMIDENKKTAKGRGYIIEDIDIMMNIGISSGYIGALVLALYINSKVVEEFYKNPQILWMVAMCMLFWISRIWLLAHRGAMTDDPIIFAAKDKISYIIILFILILVIGASL